MIWYWLFWIVVGFMIPESIALYRKRPEDTLSWQVWKLEGKGGTFVRFFVAAFFIWLFFHMTFHLFGA